MASVALDRQYSRFRFLPQLESLSGNRPLVPVVSADTSGSYVIVPPTPYVGSLSISSGFISAYSLTIATSDTVDEYNPEMVAAILRADAEKPEASFANVIDMMEWLERD